MLATLVAEQKEHWLDFFYLMCYMHIELPIMLLCRIPHFFFFSLLLYGRDPRSVTGLAPDHIFGPESKQAVRTCLKGPLMLDQSWGIS